MGRFTDAESALIMLQFLPARQRRRRFGDDRGVVVVGAVGAEASGGYIPPPWQRRSCRRR
jgi:hypothetical protein